MIVSIITVRPKNISASTILQSNICLSTYRLESISESIVVYLFRPVFQHGSTLVVQIAVVDASDDLKH